MSFQKSRAGTPTCITVQVWSSVPPSASTSTTSDSSQSGQCVSTTPASPSAAGIPSASQAQIPNQTRPAAVTKKSVGSAQNGLYVKISCESLRAMKTWPSIIRANDASTVSMSLPSSAATAAIVGTVPRVLIDRAMAMRTSRSKSASVIRDVFHQVELVVARRTDVAHARLLHHPARRDVVRVADRDDLAQAKLAEAVVETRARGFGAEATAPPFLRQVIRDLDLGTPALDVHEPAVADELAGRAELGRPQAEPVLALVTDEALDCAARTLDRRRRAARYEPHRLLVAEHTLVQQLGVADLERADRQARRFDRERQRMTNAIGRRLYGHGALSIGSRARSARSAAGHA